jgi:hypothetical protein
MLTFFKFPPNLRFESHVQHPVRLVQHDVADRVHGYCAHLDKVDQSPGRRAHKLRVAIQLLDLCVFGRPAKETAGLDAGRVAEIAHDRVDLR